jgi:hypothetical protein
VDFLDYLPVSAVPRAGFRIDASGNYSPLVKSFPSHMHNRISSLFLNMAG